MGAAEGKAPRKRMSELMSESEVICQKNGHCGIITLNRPKALNALTLTMVRGIAQTLDQWEADREIFCIAVKGAGERAFCAGGDIKRLYEFGLAGDYGEQLAFWGEEYQLNHRIATFPKPIVALIDGIVMGGGAGIGIHARHRVAGETFSFAMPEVGIGFFPDIGASYFLPRLEGRFGAYLAMTGARANLGDARAIGLVDAHVPAAKFPALLARFAAGEEAAAAIGAEAVAAPASALIEERNFVDSCFNGANLAAILADIKTAAADSAFAAKTRATIAVKSPTSLAIALKQVQLGADLDLADNLRMDLRIVTRIARGHDFYEGVRATLIDRDNAPKWQPGTVDALAANDIAAYFAPLGAGELVLPAGTAA
jgi:enoyl-CoA hydratase